MTDTKPTIYARLVDAQRRASAVAHDARNEHQRYRYTSTEAIITEARAALGAAGLAVHRVATEVQWEDAFESQGDKSRARIGTVTAKWALVEESGDSLMMTTATPAVVGKGRPEDKAVAAALTTSLGYLLRDLLLLPRVEEVADVDQREDGPPRRAPAARPALPLTDEAAAKLAAELVEGFAAAADLGAVSVLAARAATLPEDLRGPVREAAKAAKARLA